LYCFISIQQVSNVQFLTAANVRTATPTTVKSCTFLSLKTSFNMKQFLFFSFLIFTTSISFAQQKQERLEDQIRQYWFVMLMKGPNRTQDSASAAQIQRGHMANINRLYYEGKLKVAGPFGDGGNWQGIFIFDASAEKKKWKNFCKQTLPLQMED
jgi:uncharacterized protein YciI